MNACWCVKDGTEACETCEGKVIYPESEEEKSLRKKREEIIEFFDADEDDFYYPV